LDFHGSKVRLSLEKTTGKNGKNMALMVMNRDFQPSCFDGYMDNIIQYGDE
jgi:hypothetical protein